MGDFHQRRLSLRPCDAVRYVTEGTARPGDFDVDVVAEKNGLR